MFLRSVGLTERAYVEALRQDTVRRAWSTG
jgi:hypothetical protein